MAFSKRIYKLQLAVGFALLAGAATAMPVPVTWGTMPGVADGDFSGAIDFGAAGTVGFSVTNPPNSSRVLATDGAGHDFHNHPDYPSTAGQNLTLTPSSERTLVRISLDFGSYTGAAGTLIFGLDHLAGNNSGATGTDAIFNQPIALLSDLNGVGSLSPDGLNLDVLGTATGNGDFLIGGFDLGSMFIVDLDVQRNDGLRFAVGMVPPPPEPPVLIPLPASILLLLSGFGILVTRRKG